MKATEKKNGGQRKGIGNLLTSSLQTLEQQDVSETRATWVFSSVVSEPDLAAAIPAPQVSKNKDGTETVVTIFINEDGKKVKRTQRIRRTVVKKKVDKVRCFWLVFHASSALIIDFLPPRNS